MVEFEALPSDCIVCHSFSSLFRLPRHILAQENAIASITSAFSSWELSKNSDERQALVLTFSGPTGRPTGPFLALSLRYIDRDDIAFYFMT